MGQAVPPQHHQLPPQDGGDYVPSQSRSRSNSSPTRALPPAARRPSLASLCEDSLHIPAAIALAGVEDVDADVADSAQAETALIAAEMRDRAMHLLRGSRHRVLVAASSGQPGAAKRTLQAASERSIQQQQHQHQHQQQQQQ